MICLSFSLSLFFFRVPLGFVCGYPLHQGELYGGSMFARSAAPDTLQGKAIQQVNERWGQLLPKFKRGRETIGIAVCKKKYAPFRFVKKEIVHKKQSSSSPQQSSSETTTVITVERMFGCPCHHTLRKQVIQLHGERAGWEPFGQWSLKKAHDIARRATAELKQEESSSTDETDLESVSSVETHTAAPTCVWTREDSSTTLCNNGNCLWKVKSAFDNIQEEFIDEQEQEETSTTTTSEDENDDQEDEDR